MSNKKATKPAAKVVKPEQPAAQPAELGEFAKAAADINAVLKPNPPLNLKLGEEALSLELKALLPEIKEGDDLQLATWKTLKELGWAAKPAKAAAKEAASGKKEKSTKKNSDGSLTFRDGTKQALFIKFLLGGPHTKQEVVEKVGAHHPSCWGKLVAAGLGSVDKQGRMILKAAAKEVLV